MAVKSYTNVNYIVDQDGSASFDSAILDLTLAIKSVNWQIKWATGVLGEFIWEASVYPEPHTWETLVACEEVRFTIGTSNSCIVSLPDQWLTAGFTRFRFVPATGSTGLIQAAIRIVPI